MQKYLRYRELFAGRLFFCICVVGYVLFGSRVAQALPRPDHIVIVIEENKSYAEIIGNPAAPYINQLSGRGAMFTQSFGVSHPSQPNYLALFSGSTQGISSDICPLELNGDNLAGALLKKGAGFAIYSESMPQAGFTGCSYGAYMRKHNPLANWKELAALNQPFGAFPKDYAQLPAVAFVVPDQNNDMHDGSVAQGDAWLANNIELYAQWAMTHNSLLIVTWDEDDSSANNRVATLFVGPMVKTGSSAQPINHYSILRTIEEMMGLAYLGQSAQVESVAGVWQQSTVTASRSDCLFNWAEQHYAQYFSPAAISATYTPYYYRYYSGTGNYLAVSSADNNVYVQGASFGNVPVAVGSTTSFLGPSGCQ